MNNGILDLIIILGIFLIPVIIIYVSIYIGDHRTPRRPKHIYSHPELYYTDEVYNMMEKIKEENK